MKVQGRIKQVLPLRQGVSQRTGNEWKLLPFIFEYFEHETDRLADSVMLETNDQKVIDNLKEGMEVICDFGHNVREYTPQTGERAGQVQYINNMRLYSIQSVQHYYATQQQAPVQPQPAPQQTVQAAPADDVDPLPF